MSKFKNGDKVVFYNPKLSNNAWVTNSETYTASGEEYYRDGCQVINIINGEKSSPVKVSLLTLAEKPETAVEVMIRQKNTEWISPAYKTPPELDNKPGAMIPAFPEQEVSPGLIEMRKKIESDLADATGLRSRLMRKPVTGCIGGPESPGVAIDLASTKDMTAFSFYLPLSGDNSPLTISDMSTDFSVNGFGVFKAGEDVTFEYVADSWHKVVRGYELYKSTAEMRDEGGAKMLAMEDEADEMNRELTPKPEFHWENNLSKMAPMGSSTGAFPFLGK